jgi:ribosomal protein S21
MSDILIRRKKGESFEAMYRRFSRRFQQSGKKLTLMDRRFFKKKKTKTKQQESALRGLSISQKRDWLIKTGKLVEEDKYTKQQ